MASFTKEDAMSMVVANIDPTEDIELCDIESYVSGMVNEQLEGTSFDDTDFDSDTSDTWPNSPTSKHPSSEFDVLARIAASTEVDGLDALIGNSEIYPNGPARQLYRLAEQLAGSSLANPSPFTDTGSLDPPPNQAHAYMTDLSGTHPHAAFMTDLPDGNYSDYNADPAMARLQIQVRIDASMSMPVDFLYDELQDPRIQAVLERCSPWLEATGCKLYTAELPNDEWELLILSRAMTAEILRRFAFGESAVPAMSPSAHPMHSFWLHSRGTWGHGNLG
jgi:hypothetical protein